MDKGITMIIVTNEIGLGGVSSNALQRKFTDLQGMVNQYVGLIADEVYGNFRHSFENKISIIKNLISIPLTDQLRQQLKRKSTI